MKTGILFNPYTSGYLRFGEGKYAKIAQHGFSAVDYNIADTETELYTLSDRELERKMLAERAQAALAGIEFSQVHGPWRHPPQDATAQQRQERMEKMKRSILAARFLGCKYWVVHPIMPYGTHDLETGDGDKTWELNLAFMSELLEFAKKQDVTVCLENMPMRGFSIATPAQILKLVKAMDDEHFKICLDTGHVAVFPGLSLGEAVRELGDFIKVLHVHDNMGDKDAHLQPTKGIVDWPDFGNALKETGFSGVFSLETKLSAELDDEAFEAVSRELCTVAKGIIEKAGL